MILTPREKDKLAKDYQPLVNKIVNQFFKKGINQWDDLKSMALEGLAIAMNNYDEDRSDMTFCQYAAYAIRNNILTCINNELRTVKLSDYAQKKAAERGEASGFNSVSIDNVFGREDQDGNTSHNDMKYHLYENAKDCGDVYEYLYTRIEAKFKERDVEIFYMSFGLNDREELKGKEIAQHFGISEGLVSQRLKKVIEFIKKDNDLLEMLASLLD